MEINRLYDIFLKHRKVTIDSRQIQKGCLFFALRGDNFNGNNFAQQALEQGAAYCIVDEAILQGNEKIIQVNDVLDTLQKLAAFHRSEFHIPIIAITGSNGKTSTKELCSLVMQSHYKTHATQGNFNNHIGVPLTLLAMKEDTEAAIIEMGANHIGEIKKLCEIAAPTHGIITNIGKAHLEGFGGLQGVKQAKSELYQYLTAHLGTAFVNQDEQFLEELAAPCKYKVFYKSDSQFDHATTYQVEFLEANPFVKIAFADELGQRVEANSQMLGKYNFNNILTAIAVGKYFKVPTAKIKTAIENYVPQNNRSQIIQAHGNTFILDAYNANPSSMAAALQHFKTIDAEKKIIILGDMLELGKESLHEHEAILTQAFAQNPSKVITVGKQFAQVQNKTTRLHFENVAQLKSWFVEQNFSNTKFLVKGSRGMSLEKLLQ